jgi:hypothetical protein
VVLTVARRALVVAAAAAGALPLTACPEWGDSKGQAVTAADRPVAPLHVFSELTQAEYRAGARASRQVLQLTADTQRGVRPCVQCACCRRG